MERLVKEETVRKKGFFLTTVETEKRQREGRGERERGRDE
jgi:hypothetical protein